MDKRLWAVLAAELSLAFAPAPFPRPEGGDDRQKLQGTWVVSAAQRGGKPDRSTLKLQVLVKKDSLTFLHNGKATSQYTFTLDPKKKPKTIDLKRGSHAFGCVYDFRGGGWRLAYFLNGKEGERPASLEVADPRLHLVTMTRPKR
jgi:uncharacterized protein (TIGR03067 family)